MADPCKVQIIDRATGVLTRCIRKGKHARHSDGCLEWTGDPRRERRRTPGRGWRASGDAEGVDEIVVDDWLRLERMNKRDWFLLVGGLRIGIHVPVDPDEPVRAVVTEGENGGERAAD